MSCCHNGNPGNGNPGKNNYDMPRVTPQTRVIAWLLMCLVSSPLKKRNNLITHKQAISLQLKNKPCNYNSQTNHIFTTHKQTHLTTHKQTPPLGDKVSMLTHIYPHKTRRKIEVIICKITRLTAHFMCGLMSDLLICTCL